jgi:hypothetical protein
VELLSKLVRAAVQVAQVVAILATLQVVGPLIMRALMTQVLVTAVAAVGGRLQAAQHFLAAAAVQVVKLLTLMANQLHGYQVIQLECGGRYRDNVSC